MNQLVYSVNAAKTDFCKLATLVAAGGCEVLITRHRKPIARITALEVEQPTKEDSEMNTKDHGNNKRGTK